MIEAESQQPVDGELIAITVLGVVLLVASVWSWRGRSSAARWWVRDGMGRGFVLGMMPGMGACLTGVGYFAIVGDRIDLGLIDTILAFIGVIGFFVAMLGLFNLLPRFLEPSWYRPALRAAEEEFEVNAEALSEAGLGGHPGLSSHDVLQHELAMLPGFDSRERRPLHRWGANWVRDPDTLHRDHGAAPRGAVPGHLELRRASVGFVALGLEDRIRGEAIAWAVSFEQLTAVRLVPPRAGLDGIPRRGVLHRSLWKRLVLETDDRAYLVDVRRPKKVLGQIERLRNDVTR